MIPSVVRGEMILSAVRGGMILPVVRGRKDPIGRPRREGMSPVGSPRRSEIFAESQKSPNPRTPTGFTPCCASRGTGHPLRAAGGTFPRVDTLPDLSPERRKTLSYSRTNPPKSITCFRIELSIQQKVALLVHHTCTSKQSFC